MRMRSMVSSSAEAGKLARRWLRNALARLGEPPTLLVSVGLAVLTLLWFTTVHLIAVERTNAERAAIASSRELAETYEAQVVRALREIDEALKVVKFTYEHGEQVQSLADLKSHALLPPDLLFIVSITDAQGNVVESTRPTPTDAAEIRRDQAALRLAGGLRINGATTLEGPLPADRPLRFSRRLDDARGEFAGMVTISVDAEYFVSGYEESRLGARGVIGVLGTDGAFRARRSGDATDAGDGTRYAGLLPANGDVSHYNGAVTSPWDGTRRYTSTRRLYGFPLAVVVGLSETEQLAVASQRRHADLGWATAGIALTLAIIAALARLSSQLAGSRQRATDDQVEHALQVEAFAHHDALTGLPNRALFINLLAERIERASRHNTPVAVLYFDLDGFRPVNDSFGHAAGDLLLIETSTRLQRASGAGAIVARVAADEFLLLLDDIAGMDECVAIAQRLIDAMRMSFDVLGYQVQLSACVGIAVYPTHGNEDNLVVNADAALYAAKRSGPETWAIFDPSMAGKALEELDVLNHLRHAVALGQISLHYQPKIDALTDELSGFEALLRWQHPLLGVVSPAVFVPLAERFGLIQELGNWVITEACRQMRAWADAGLQVKVAVNVSAHQLRRDGLAARIEEALSQNGIRPSQLLVEITESVMMEDIRTTQAIFEALSRLGVFLSIDDFGTGHSSLSYLRQLPATQLKIDRSFVSDLEASADARAIVDAVVRLAHALDLRVVAEGVETRGQQNILQQLGCDELQGYFFARPMSAPALVEWLREKHTKAA